MSTTSTATRIADEPGLGLSPRAVGVGAAAVGLASLVAANFVTPGENGGAAEFAITAGFTLLAAAVVFGLVVPRAIEGGRLVRTALILTALAGLGGIVFWSGLAQVAAPAAILLGTRAMQRDDASDTGAWIAVAVSGLLYVAVLTACVIG